MKIEGSNCEHYSSQVSPNIAVQLLAMAEETELVS